ncbi:hypothetical protein BKA69DRAFT_638329 [Paraphysoderma sedebokerense]|nr:hypothetical protein BKA69DRAFT_638329 [Paraphysoderma sedebokerense]
MSNYLVSRKIFEMTIKNGKMNNVDDSFLQTIGYSFRIDLVQRINRMKRQLYPNRAEEFPVLPPDSNVGDEVFGLEYFCRLRNQNFDTSVETALSQEMFGQIFNHNFESQNTPSTAVAAEPTELPITQPVSTSDVFVAETDNEPDTNTEVGESIRQLRVAESEVPGSNCGELSTATNQTTPIAGTNPATSCFSPRQPLVDKPVLPSTEELSLLIALLRIFGWNEEDDWETIAFKWNQIVNLNIFSE